jgi:hypothetical protein
LAQRGVTCLVRQVKSWRVPASHFASHRVSSVSSSPSDSVTTRRVSSCRVVSRLAVAGHIRRAMPRRVMYGPVRSVLSFLGASRHFPSSLVSSVEPYRINSYRAEPCQIELVVSVVSRRVSSGHVRAYLVPACPSDLVGSRLVSSRRILSHPVASIISEAEGDVRQISSDESRGEDLA